MECKNKTASNYRKISVIEPIGMEKWKKFGNFVTIKETGEAIK
jgi:hypothetical protein